MWDIPKNVNKKIKKVAERYTKNSSIGRAINNSIVKNDGNASTRDISRISK